MFEIFKMENNLSFSNDINNNNITLRKSRTKNIFY